MPTTQGHGGLLFGLSTIISSPQAVDGVGLGGRYFLIDRMALRGGLGLTHTQSELEADGDTSDGPKNTQFNLELGAEYVLAQFAGVGIYAGGISVLAIGVEEVGEADSKSTTVGITLAGVLGAYYFLAQAVSIGAEYRLGFSYLSVDNDDGGFDSKQTGWVIGTGTAGFHLGFWF